MRYVVSGSPVTPPYLFLGDHVVFDPVREGDIWRVVDAQNPTLQQSYALLECPATGERRTIHGSTLVYRVESIIID